MAIDHGGPDGELYRAAARGEVEDARRAFDAGGNPNAQDSLGRTPLIRAAAAGHVETARALLERGADPTIADDNGFSPAEVATMNGHKAVAEVIRLHGGNADPETLIPRIADALGPGFTMEARVSVPRESASEAPPSSFSTSHQPPDWMVRQILDERSAVTKRPAAPRRPSDRWGPLILWVLVVALAVFLILG